MGVHPNIGCDRRPKQGSQKGATVRVMFNYDHSREIGGTVIRDDVEEPFQTLIMLDDGFCVRATECQYSIVTPGEPWGGGR